MSTNQTDRDTWRKFLGIKASLCSTCTKQKLKIGRYTAFPMLAMLISPSPHNLTVAILRFYHNPIFL